MRYIILLLLLLVVNLQGNSQTLDPFTIRYQNLQKGGIRIISNVSLGASNSALNFQSPPSGNSYNNNATMGYVDIDGNASTFMSSSDSLNLNNCSEILWAGLYWGALIGNNAVQTTLTNYANRDKVKVKINNGAYTTLTADEIFNQTTNTSYKTYHCFKNVTSLVTNAGIKAKFTIADLVSLNHTQFPSTNGPYGGWSIVVVYKNIFESQRLLTVYDGLTSVNGTNQVNIPISGFVTPQVGPVSFELGIVTLDGDRGVSGDQLKFNNLNISDAIHNVNDVCNSTISYNGVLTPFRNPSYTNTLGYDANIFIPNNASQQYIGNNATTASISQTSTGDQYFSQVVTFAIDVYEPDLRASVSINDLNGGNVAPGDILEYTIVGKNIGSDIANGVYIRDTLDPRTVYLPNSLQISYGPNTGLKTDVNLDDQAEYFSASKVVQFRVGTGANATNGGQMLSANSGADSTVVKFKVTVINDCLMFQCDSTLDHKAYIFGTSAVSGNFFNNNGLADYYGPNGCPAIASNVLSINVTGCPPDAINGNSPICAGTNLSLSMPNSTAAQYTWSGPNGFTSTGFNNASVSNTTIANSGLYTVHIIFPGLNCAIDKTKLVTINPLPIINLVNQTNVLCNGFNTGSLAVNGTNGSAPYTYLWQNTIANDTISNLTAGTYTIQITDSNLCVKNASYTITQPTPISAAITNSTNFNGVNISCYNGNNGGAIVLASGGVGPYTYLWNNGSIINNPTNLIAGTNTVTVTDTNLCTLSVSTNLTQPAELQLSETHQNISCHNGNDGTITLTVTGGTAPFTYSWSNGSTNQNLANLTIGTYSVTATDVNGCTDTISVTLTQPLAPISSSDTHVNVLCKGFSTGSIDLTVNGGTAPYTYLWSNGQLTQDIDTLISGQYSVIITDSKLCAFYDTVFISEPLNALSVTSIVTPVGCFGDSTGAINITVAGGTFPYTYSWTSTALSEDINNLITGNYIVTITDTHSCVLISDTINIPQPLAPLSISHTIDDVNCFGGNDGAIDLTVNGGTAPYTYSWSNGQTTQDLLNLITDTFNVIVTDVNNCVIHDSSIFVPQPAASYILSTVNTDVLCYGFSTGAINFNVTGGTLPYTYLWSNGQTTQDIDSITVGTYEVIVTDAKGCKDSITTTLIQPLTPLALSITHTDALCIGGTQGTIDLTAGGGTGPYTYFWNNNETVPDIDSLNQGFYYVLVTDAHGCFDTISATVLDPNNTMVLSIGKSDVLCYAGSDGTVDLTVQFGTPGYSYLWNTGDTTQDLNNVPIGTYSVDVTDFNSCGAFISIAVNQPATPVSGTTSTVDVLCKTFATGSIDASASGGIAPYTYLWSNTSTNQDIQILTAGIYQLTIKDSHNCILIINDTIFEPATLVSATNTQSNVNCYGGSDASINLIPAGGVGNYTFSWTNFETTEDIDSLTLGTYSVTITDSNGCIFPYSVVITQPSAPISLTTAITNVSCFGGSNGVVNLTPSGGTNPYTYFWSDSTTNQDLVNYPFGTYSVIVTDTNNCVDSIVGIITQPTLLVINGSTTPVICHGDATGTATVVANGGTPGYSYLWSNGDLNALNDTIITGSYSVLVTDSLGCKDSLTVFVNEPTLLTSSTTHIDNPCYGNSVGSVSVVPVGGIAPYTYSWSNFATSATTSNLIAGVYTVIVTDSNNCIVNDTSEVIQPLAPLAINFVTTDNICYNGSIGAIDASISGGTTPYSYSWNTTAITEDIASLPIGIYTLTVTDDHNCVLAKTDTIVQPTQIDTSNVILDDISCNGFSDGSINLTTVGGTAPYTYLWSNNTTNEDLTNVIIGTYTITITDDNLCTRQFTYTLNQPLPLISTYTTIEPLCYAYSDGSITLNTTGGTTPYSYSWTNGSTSAVNSGIVTGNYTATITDAQNCAFVVPCFIDQPNQIQVSFNVSDTVGCDPTTIEFTNTSDEQFISTWEFGDGNSATGNNNITNTYTSPGCFDVSLTVESPIGCTNSVIYPSIICINPTPVAGISANPTTLDTSNPETEILNTTMGAVSYEWNMGDNGLYSFFQPGMYTYPMYTLNEFLITLTATSDKGCVDTAQYKIYFDNSLIFYVPNTFTPDGNEYNNVFKPILTSIVDTYVLQIYNRWG
ncbi:MAG: DUF11 domain-containing protein, partial [Crocinitomicaceae bacterium]|nr:DUF11 domain-containing protein [Crocinitomicaceae bacterium]